MLTFYMNCAMYAQKQQLQCTPPPLPTHTHNPLHIALCSCLVHVLKNCFTIYVSEHEAWADKIYRRFVNLRTDYQKLEHQRDPSHPLTACQQWKLTDLSYLKTFYKQGYKSVRGATSRTSTEHSSDEEADDRGHESSSSSRRETPTKIPVPNPPMPARRPKKRRDDRTDSDKDETSSKLNEIVGVMKDSANHLVARSQTLAHDPREQERVSFFQLDVGIRKQNATSELA